MRYLVMMTGWIGWVLLAISCSAENIIPLDNHPVTDAHPGWKMAVQSYTFRKFTFFQAIDKVSELGLNWIEVYPTQVVSEQWPDVRFQNMTAEIKEATQNKLRQAGIKLINYGVVNLTEDEAQCRKMFDFAKEIGVQTIISEPPKEAMALIDRLCQEYKIKMAIHNHPKPSHYWDPDTVLAACEGCSEWVGACADTGHWMRSGVNPLEAIKKLKGRIISLHLKDLNEFGKLEAHDLPWGTGMGQVKEILAELDQQGFQGVFSIEYEYDWDDSVPALRKCVAYFDKVAAALKSSGWHNLLADDLSNCIFKPDSWTLEDAVLTRKGGGDIWTKDKYGNFLLDLQFKVDKDTNSGVFIRTGDIVEWLHTAIEVQIFDSYGKDKPDKHDCGGIFDCVAPSQNMVLPPGQWNRLTIAAVDNHIDVVMNGQRIIDMDLNQWSEAHKNPDGTPNKFNTAYKDMPRVGNIGFQDHGHPVWYRNIKIKTLD